MQAETTDTPVSLAKLISRIAGTIASDQFPTGERAALRRLQPDRPPSVAFYRFFYRYVEGHWSADRHIPTWITLLAGMALLYPRTHQPGRRVGQALAEAHYSEARLERLLEAEDRTQEVLLIRAVRFLAAKGEAIDWNDFAYLLFARNEDDREAQRRRIARDFYRNLPRD